MSFAQYSASADESNDPATWDSASYLDNPIDHLEPLNIPANAYREAAIRQMRVSYVIDLFMSQQKNGVRGWIVVSIVMGYPSTQGRTMTSIAEEMGITKQALSHSCTHFSRMVGLPPSFGMKSIAARQTYQQTNGRSASEQSDKVIDSEIGW